MTNTHIRIRDKRTDEIYIEGEFQNIVKADESAWCVEDNEKITLALFKANENIWTTIIKGDGLDIDGQKVENTKRLD